MKAVLLTMMDGDLHGIVELQNIDYSVARHNVARHAAFQPGDFSW
jgi:hypothetical protein